LLIPFQCFVPSLRTQLFCIISSDKENYPPFHSIAITEKLTQQKEYPKTHEQRIILKHIKSPHHNIGMRTCHKKAMSTSIMLIMAAVVTLVAAIALVSILSKPASQTAQTGEELTDLLEGKGSLTCDIKCFECCHGSNPSACGTVDDPETENCDCKHLC